MSHPTRALNNLKGSNYNIDNYRSDSDKLSSDLENIRLEERNRISDIRDNSQELYFMFS